MRLHRFYVSQPLGEEVVIEDVPTIKQWLKVFRYTEGDFVILFNGDGYSSTYRLEKASPLSCTLLRTEQSLLSLPNHRSFLFLAVIKKDFFELVVKKATEAGITDIVPLITEHTEKKNLNLARLNTIIKEATEQCGRNDILIVHPPLTWNESFPFLTSRAIASENTYVATLFGKPLQDIVLERISLKVTDSPLPTAFFVGPEGGWSEEEEVVIKEKNFTAISLGKNVLRAETAGIYCALLSSLL